MAEPVSDSAVADVPPPLVIFGTTHSGTRVFARLARHAGYFMGDYLNHAEDSLHMARFLRRRVNWYLARWRWVDDELAGREVAPPTELEAAKMLHEFRAAVELQRSGIPDERAPWGWKNPANAYVLPFLHWQYPELRVIHVVRDGRDNAYSKDRREAERFGRSVLTEAERQLPLPVERMILWSRLNLAAARYGARRLGGRYLRVRLEDLCADPPAVVGRVFEHLGASPASAPGFEAAVAEVATPSSIGRWREAFGEEIVPLREAGEQALRELGYSTDGSEAIRILLEKLERRDAKIEKLRTKLEAVRAGREARRPNGPIDQVVAAEA